MRGRRRWLQIQRRSAHPLAIPMDGARMVCRWKTIWRSCVAIGVDAQGNPARPSGRRRGSTFLETELSHGRQPNHRHARSTASHSSGAARRGDRAPAAHVRRRAPHLDDRCEGQRPGYSRTAARRPAVRQPPRTARRSRYRRDARQASGRAGLGAARGRPVRPARQPPRHRRWAPRRGGSGGRPRRRDPPSQPHRGGRDPQLRPLHPDRLHRRARPAGRHAARRQAERRSTAPQERG